MLAKVLKRGGNILVLDEPTNDLDLASLRMLEEALVDFEGSVLVVSHDRFFLDRVCDQIVAFEDETGIFVQPGNYSYYLEKKQQRLAAVPPAFFQPAQLPPQKKTVLRAMGSSAPRKLSFKEQRELEGMEAAIMTAETRVHELESTLNDPGFHAQRSQDAHEMVAELDVARLEVSRLYEPWQELSRRAAAAKPSGQ